MPPTLFPLIVGAFEPRMLDRYWAPLVEKAAAKLRGCYAKMEHISLQDSMTLLVGASCISYNRKHDSAFVDFDFALCDKWQRRGALFVASTHCHGTSTVNGIISKHAYSVLQVRRILNYNRIAV
jgi:hypothetical protein